MGEKQGLINVADAARLAATAAPHVRFVLVGDGGQRSRVETAAAGVTRLEIRDPMGAEDYPRLLAAADVLLVNERPGLLEMAVPSKLTSYFSSGRPVLAATEPGSTTAGEVSASGAGLVVPPGDPAALLDGVAALVADPAAAEARGAAGLDYCRRVLSPDVSLDASDRWVRSLAEGRGRR
jgi:glycosyltransferase involved in cell wall biosynthesis